MIVTLRGRGKVIFAKMDKFERRVGGRDVQWAKQVGVFDFFNIWLTPIWPLMKEWLHGIIRYTPQKIYSVVQGQPISLTEKIVSEMLHLPNVGITIRLNYKQDEIIDMCIRLTLKDAIVHKEG